MPLKMRSIVFIAGYFGVAIFGVRAIVATDPEPLGASISLWLFALAGVVVASVTYSASASWWRRSPRKFAALFAGALCAAVFFAGLSLTHFGFGLTAPFCAAAIALQFVALIAPLCSAA
jgi:hypothetical protein